VIGQLENTLKDDGSTIVRNVGNSSPNDTTLHSRRLDFKRVRLFNEGGRKCFALSFLGDGNKKKKEEMTSDFTDCVCRT